MKTYGISIANGGRISMAELRAFAEKLCRSDLVARIDELERTGCRYSNHDHDVLAPVWSALGWPRIDIVNGTAKGACNV